MPYLDSLDLAKRACQHLGVPQVLDTDEDSRANFELAFAYDKVREAELRRNTWRCAIKTVVLRAIGPSTMLFVPNLWDEDTLYLPGAVVRDENNDLWVSDTPENISNTPGNSQAWDQYFGPATADVWVANASYFIGDIVYKRTSDSAASYVVFRSLVNGNTSEPETPQAWAVNTTYGLNETVTYSGFQWRSLIAFNTNNTPATGPAAWFPTATYGTGFTATGEDGFIYSSVGEGNLGNSPVEDDGTHWTNTGVPNAWSKAPSLYPGSQNWIVVYAALRPVFQKSPIGYGPNLQAPSRAIYHLPANYLREAPRDPKAGSVTVFGAPTGLAYNDWLFQGDYLLTCDTGPIMFRFVADITIVAEMDAMFCEALAARMALASAEALTASSQKKRDIEGEYGRWVSEARMVNGIETGSEEPPEDDWITCRA